jgi:hypothetical protein
MHSNLYLTQLQIQAHQQRLHDVSPPAPRTIRAPRNGGWRSLVSAARRVARPLPVRRPVPELDVLSRYCSNAEGARI